MTVRLAVVVSHPTQHFVPLYAELASLGGVDLKVFYIGENGVKPTFDAQFGVNIEWDTPMLNGYSYEFVESGKVLSDFGFWSVDSPLLVEKLNAFDADVLWVHGYAQRANWRAIYSKKSNTKVLYTSDSNAWINSTRTNSWARRQLKSLIIRRFFSYIDIALSISPANRQYLLDYGLDPNKIIDSSFPVDIERLSIEKESLTDQELTDLRSNLSIARDAKVLLVVSKLIDRKRVQDAVEALARLSDEKTHLLIVGSGECHSDLQNKAVELNVSNRVHFSGFVNQKSLSNYFSIADILVFPSENEPYGAVVSEVLPFGLPVVIASDIGAIGASAIEGENAMVFQVGDVADLTRQLERLLANNDVLQAYSAKSLSMAKEHDKRVMAMDIINICRAL